MRKLALGARGDDVRALQTAINARARSRGLPTVTVDGDYGKNTDDAAQRISRALGSLESTIAQPGTTVGEQRIIRWPTSRTPAQLIRARQRAKSHATSTITGPQAALREAGKHVGKTEWSHRSTVLLWIKRCLGIDQRVAWCGVFLHHCLTTAGVKNLTGRMASVWFILEDAIHSRNGLARVVYRRRTGHGSVKDGRPGDLAGMYGEGTHVGMLLERVPGGWRTREGNTSSANQANGGTVAEKVRPDSAIVYIVRPRYPKDS